MFAGATYNSVGTPRNWELTAKGVDDEYILCIMEFARQPGDYCTPVDDSALFVQ
jgi:hypothetical protein